MKLAIAVLPLIFSVSAFGQAVIVTQQVVTTQVAIVPMVTIQPACKWHQFVSGDVVDDCTYYVVTADMVAHGVKKAKLVDAPVARPSELFECTVVVSMIVDEKGNSQQNRVVKHCGHGLDEAALAVTPSYKFESAEDQYGVAIATKVNITVDFKAVR